MLATVVYMAVWAYGDQGPQRYRSKRGFVGSRRDIELAAIELKNAVTRQRLTDLKVQGERQAMDMHHEVGKEIRSTLRNSGAEMPENLKPVEPIKNLTDRQPKLIPSLS